MKAYRLLLVLAVAGCAPAAQVKIGSKAFTEGVILGELATQLVRSTGVQAEHRQQLGGTQILWQALQNGEIDAYLEYTGTISEEILTDRGLRDEDAIRRTLAAQGVLMSRSLGFANTYAMGMREDVADRLSIRTISDLRRHPDLKLRFSNEFMQRSDGWPSLRNRYQLPQRDVRGLEHSLAYPALKSGAIQVTDLYSTDAKIREYGLQVLQDDLGHFPPYHAVLLYRADLEERRPEAVAALRQLESRISESAMVDMNARADGDKVPETRVAADFLAQNLGLQVEVRTEGTARQVLRYTTEHLFLVAISLAVGILTAVPLGIVAARRPGIGQVILGVAGIIQTIPALALLVFMLPLLALVIATVPGLQAAGFSSLGALPAIIALFLYSLLPMVRNTYAGLHDIPAHIRESAEALGLPPLARLRLVELPLAARSILAGIKTAAVISVGYAALGGLISAGGYGEPIVTGLRRNDWEVTLWQGAVPAALLALLVQGLFELAERFLVPKGLRLRAE